jgi:hypothetical protein
LFEGEFSDLNKCSKLNKAFLLPFLFDAGDLGKKKEGVETFNDISNSYTTQRQKNLLLTAYYQYNEVPQ